MRACGYKHGSKQSGAGSVTHETRCVRGLARESAARQEGIQGYELKHTIGNATIIKGHTSQDHILMSSLCETYIAIPGTGFREGTAPTTGVLGFMGLGPGAGPRRGALAWFAEFDLGRPIWDGGAI